MKEKILSRFLKYVSFDTQSDPDSETFPSTARQLLLMNHLVEEMSALGLTDVEIDEHGYASGTIPATSADASIPVIGFISHVDTAPDMSGADVRPQIVKNYDGKDIVLNTERDIVLKVSDFPELKNFIGHTLITTDGTTLLGADDKAGIAEIMTAAEYLMSHPEIQHGKIRIGFTPDEEVGRGVDHFNVERFGAQYAYTMDGSSEGELEYENFNAAAANITINGRNIHPGYAKGKMINSLIVATEINELLPISERPEFTEGYEGFYHLIKIDGSVEHARVQYIIRDHDRTKFEKKKQFMRGIISLLNARYGEGVVELELKDQYYNMREMVEPHMHIVDAAVAAMQEAGIKPKVQPIRGGTDGARLSYMGLPCPNIFAGGMNFHGKYEYTSLESMTKAAEVIVNICKNFGAK